MCITFYFRIRIAVTWLLFSDEEFTKALLNMEEKGELKAYLEESY